jgi:hypothetical protein
LRIFRWGCLLAVLIGLACVAAVVVLIARPARIIGVDQKPLASSIEGELPRDEEADCDDRGGPSGFSCRVSVVGNGGSGLEAARTYVVRADGWGCWTARWQGGDPVADQKVSGCIGILDYVFD